MDELLREDQRNQTNVRCTVILLFLELSLEDHGISPNATTAGAKYLTTTRMYTVHHPLPGNQNTTSNDNAAVLEC